jgi:hypothetical protein
LNEKVAAPAKKTELTAGGIRCADHATPSIRKSWNEGVRGSGCIDPHFLDLGTSWRWVVSFTPRPLSHPGKEPPPVPIGKEAGWAPEPVWATWRQFLTLPGLEP